LEQRIIIGSRGSDLALWQARYVQSQLKDIGLESDIEIIKTKGDVIQNVSFDKIEGKGFFTKEIEAALLEGQIDVAVHSYKDLPTENTPGLVIAANSKREDPRDLLIIQKSSFDQGGKWNLKPGANVGTSSLRRKRQLQLFRPDLNVVPIRGNVPTRIDKIGKDNLDAIVIAAAGVNRLQPDLKKYVQVPLSAHEFIPAAAQGVLAYQCKEDDKVLRELLRRIHDLQVEECIQLERTLLGSIGGGCQSPVGIHCIKKINQFHLWISREEDEDSKRVYLKHSDLKRLEKDAKKVMEDDTRKKVFISRSLEEESHFLKILQRQNHKVSHQSLIRFKKKKFEKLPESQWIFFSSKNGVKHFFTQVKKAPERRYACIGQGTAQELQQKIKQPIDFIGSGSAVSEIADHFLEEHKPESILFPIAENSARTIQKRLEGKAALHDLIVYTNSKVDKFKDPYSNILVFTSPMNANTYYAKIGVDSDQVVVAIGYSTEQALIKLGVKNIRVAYAPDEVSLAASCF